MGSKKVRAPAPRNYEQEMRQAVAAQRAIMPDVLEAEREFMPQFQQLQKETLMGQIGVMEGVYDKAIPIAARLSEAQASAMAPAFARVGETSRSAYNASLSPTANSLIAMLEEQAASDLSLGKGLSGEENIMAQQAARSASQARGMGLGNQAIANEVLSNYGLSQQREMMRRSFAANVYGMSENSAARAYQMYGAPLINMLGGTTAGGLVTSGASAAGALGPSLVNPESSYNSAMITANRKEQMDAAMFNAQQSNAMTGSIIGAAATIGGAFLGGPAFAAMMAPSTAGAAAGGLLAGATTSMVPASALSTVPGLGGAAAGGNALLSGGGGFLGGGMPAAGFRNAYGAAL